MVKSTKEDIINKLAELNFYMKDDGLYINTNTRMTIYCSIHNEEWISTVGEAYRKVKYCKKCRELDGSWRDIAKSKEYTILNESGIRASFQCKFKHDSWTTQKSHIKFTECKICSGRQITLQQVLDKLKAKKFELLNKEEYKSTKTRGKFKCYHGHEWETEIHNVYSDKSECPTCGTNSLESRCKFILETIFNKRFCKTRNVVEGNLELDMYNMELKLACEAQGPQHFIYHPNYFHKNGGFEEQQERDSRKKKWCEENDIKLIIVKYDISTFDAQIEYILSLDLKNYLEIN